MLKEDVADLDISDIVLFSFLILSNYVVDEISLIHIEKFVK